MTAFRHSFPGVGLLQVGAYLLPECASFFLRVPGREIVDRVVGLDSLWTDAERIEANVTECADDASRVTVLEAALIRHLKPQAFSIAANVARLVRMRNGQLNVGSLARTTGHSRQYLRRVFQDRVGLSPKVYMRLCRFRTALSSPDLDTGWAAVAGAAGYFDQSHMISEFREFSGMTPATIVRQRAFHPFTGR